MIHAREDYKCIQDPSGKIPEDEPVFLLRGQDPLAPRLLKIWANELARQGGDVNMCKMVSEHSNAMIAWQKTHPTHIPDLPTNPSKIVTAKDTDQCSCGCGSKLINPKKDG